MAVETDRFLNMREAAEMIGIPTRSLYHLRATGQGPRSIMMGAKTSKIMFRVSAIQEWLAEKDAAEDERLNRLHRETDQIAG